MGTRKKHNEKFLNVLGVTVDQIKNIAIFIHPIMPDASIKILQIIGISETTLLFEDMKAINLYGNKLSKVNHLLIGTIMIIDSHCHLISTRYEKPINEIIDICDASNISLLLNIATKEKNLMKLKVSVININKFITV